MKKNLLMIVLGALLLSLSFRSFGLWFFVFVGLVPYTIFLFTERTRSQYIIGSAVFGATFSLCVHIQVLYAHPFIFIPTALIHAALFALLGALWFSLRRRTIIDVFSFATLWTLGEYVGQFILKEYHYLSLAYGAYGIPTLLALAGIGGAYLVSFFIALINAFIADGFVRGIRRHLFILFGAAVLLVMCLCVLQMRFVNNQSADTRVSFALMQLPENTFPYARRIDGTLYLDATFSRLLDEANAQGTDYIMYPHNLVPFAVAPNELASSSPYIHATISELSELLAPHIRAGTTFIFWTDMLQAGGNEITDTVLWWKDGAIIGQYDKRRIYPFFDATSQYFRDTNIFTKPYAYTASATSARVVIGDLSIGNLSCSEINYSTLAREDASGGAHIFLSLGYASVFEYPLYGRIVETLAQLRAAETGLPIIRADIRGPSIVVDANGSVVAESRAEYGGVMTADIAVSENPQKNLYTLFGDWPLISVLLVFFLGIGILNRRK